jgi:hypothetical protein
MDVVEHMPYRSVHLRTPHCLLRFLGWKTNVLLPVCQKFPCGPEIAKTVFRDFEIFARCIEVLHLISGDALGFWAFDTEFFVDKPLLPTGIDKKMFEIFDSSGNLVKVNDVVRIAWDDKKGNDETILY